MIAITQPTMRDGASWGFRARRGLLGGAAPLAELEGCDSEGSGREADVPCGEVQGGLEAGAA
jgi:hypothetical protein